MYKLDFPRNESLSLGVEIEIQLIDPITGDLKPVGPEILKELHGVKDAEHIKSELFQSMLEIDTPICKDAFEIGHSLRKSLDVLRHSANQFSAKVMMAGTHPFAHYTERLLTPNSRYYSLVDRNKWITRRLQIFGLHIHIGMKNGEHAIAMNNALCHYLPVLLALSASSPYWQNQDTGLASSRITIFEAIPTGGHPYLLNSWSEFEDLVSKLISSNSITSVKDLWWDIRPNIEFGTIEVRIADCPPTIKEVESLVALVHCLATFIDKEIAAGRFFSPPPEWILRENKWRASRHGVQCDLIKNPKGEGVSFTHLWPELCSTLDSIVESYNYKTLFTFLNLLVTQGPSYERQRSHYQDDIGSIVRHLLKENESDQPDWSN